MINFKFYKNISVKQNTDKRLFKFNNIDDELSIMDDLV